MIVFITSNMTGLLAYAQSKGYSITAVTGGYNIDVPTPEPMPISQGSPGPAGPTGPTGPQGATGPQGPQGLKGDTGDRGLTGLTGETGAAGADSTVPGPTGPQGTAGATGPQGPAGADSIVPGPAGPQGIQGPAGLDGADGAAGPQGIQGPAGATGATGAAGADGADADTITGALVNLITVDKDNLVDAINELVGKMTSGTWTPSICGVGTYVTQEGNWKKIGGVVFFNLKVQYSNKGSPSGTVYITLPFDKASRQTGRLGVQITYVGSLSGQTISSLLGSFIGGAYINICDNSGTNIAVSALANDTRFDIQGFYEHI